MEITHKKNENRGDNCLKILVIDDNQDIAELARLSLQLLPMRTNITTSIALSEAMALVKCLRFDVVVTDRQIPYENEGFELAKMVKKLSPSTKVLLMSGTISDDSDAKDVKNAGCFDAWISKPFGINMLQKKILGLLAGNSAPEMAEKSCHIAK